MRDGVLHECERRCEAQQQALGHDCKLGSLQILRFERGDSYVLVLYVQRPLQYSHVTLEYTTIIIIVRHIL